MAKIETSREHRTRPGQNNGTIVELRFETIERLVKISEEGWILRVDLVGIHRHDDHMRVFSFNDPRHRTSSNLRSRLREDQATLNKRFALPAKNADWASTPRFRRSGPAIHSPAGQKGWLDPKRIRWFLLPRMYSTSSDG